MVVGYDYMTTKSKNLIFLIIFIIIGLSLYTPFLHKQGNLGQVDTENSTTSLVEPHNERYEYVSMVARVSCYTDKGLTASGEYVRHGIVAVSDRNISMKSQLYLEEFGIMDVRDKTATWVRDKYPVMTIDVWMTEEECKEFGLKYLTYKLL
jgi:3D (Asp-Asp-Asp) domain-containing protein